MNGKNKQAFTLIEVLLVIAIIAVLAAAVFVAINPGKNIADARNTTRRSHLAQIMSAISQANLQGVALAGLPDCTTTPAGTSIGTGVGLINPAALVPTYIAGIPVDPVGGTAADTGYKICTTSTNPTRWKVMAPNSVADGASPAVSVEQ